MSLPYSAPFERVEGSRRDVLLICDHASNAVPSELHDLGLDAERLASHIAWDPGASAVTRHMAALFDCTAMLGGVSRLVTDLNRRPDNATLILAESDNVFVPGNLEITDAERARRIALYHAPYHAALRAEIDARVRDGIAPVIIAIHSFNPVLGDDARPWPIGVLWKLSRDPVARLIEGLALIADPIGDNKPYDGRTHLGWTVNHHAIDRGLPHVMFEIRNDQIATEIDQLRWARELHRVLSGTGFVPGG